MKKNILFFLAIINTFFFNAQSTIQWQKSLGGTAGDYAQSIHQTFDGGYITAGYAFSNNGDVTGNHGNTDFWVVKLDNTGATQWQKSFGGSGYDDAYCVRQTADSGFVVAGYVSSNNGDVTGNHGSDDFWIVKLSKTGVLQWQKCLGGTGPDDAFFIRQTADGGYIVTGDTQSNNGDVSNNNGSYDCWVVKLDAGGNILWQKCLGGTNDDTSSSVEQTSDGGYIISGSTRSNNGDVSGNHGDWDYWVVKLDASGNIQWQKCLGGAAEDIGYSIKQTTSGEYIISGFTKSTNGDVSGMHGSGVLPDQWVVKLDGTGNIQWQKCLGGTNDDKAYCIDQTSDGGYVVAGYSKSGDGDVSGVHGVGTHDFWVVKLDGSGNILWQKCFGGTGIDWARSVQQTAEGGYVVAGFTTSNNNDVTGNHGDYDFWVVKLDLATSIKEYDIITWQVFPNPTNGIFAISGNMLQGNTVLKIYNPLGQLIYSQVMNTEKIQVNLSAYARGIYVTTITSENYKWTGKIIIE